MRNILQLLASFALLAAQAISPQANLAATAQASAPAVETHLEVSINPNQTSPLVVTAPARPDFDADVLVPLRAAQAQTAAKARAEALARAQALAAAKASADAAARDAAARPVVSTQVGATSATSARVGIAPATPENMQALRMCEAGNIYSRNSGNGFYGAYQFDIGTWGGWGGYARADLAPAAVQDQKFLETYSRRGWAPWPSCSRKLGLM